MILECLTVNAACQQGHKPHVLGSFGAAEHHDLDSRPNARWCFRSNARDQRAGCSHSAVRYRPLGWEGKFGSRRIPRWTAAGISRRIRGHIRARVLDESPGPMLLLYLLLLGVFIMIRGLK